MKNKKADILDMLVYMVVIFILAIGFFIFAFVVPEITDGLRNAGLNGSAEGLNAIETLNDFGTITIQRGFFLLFIGLAIGVMISSFFIRTHVIWFFLYILFLGLTVFIGSYLGNAYETMVENPIFAERLADQTLINIVMNNMIVVLIGIGALSLIIIFGKFVFASPGGQAI